MVTPYQNQPTAATNRSTSTLDSTPAADRKMAGVWIIFALIVLAIGYAIYSANRNQNGSDTMAMATVDKSASPNTTTPVTQRQQRRDH